MRHNNILGFFIEVGAVSAKPMLEEPLSDTFRHRQTMANAVRFTTTKLAEIEGQIASAAERATAIENEVFATLGQAIGAEEQALSELGRRAWPISIAWQRSPNSPTSKTTPARSSTTP